MGLSPLGRAQWRYCAKVGLAAALGYLLTQGGQNHYAVYSAFTAALIVGATVGEDLATSVNRVKGTLTGMLAGMAVAAFFGPSALAVGVVVAVTALLALALGWGIPVARIGVTLCIVTLVVHRDDALEYDLMRAANTLIGVAVGLAVSFFVWPAHARGERARSTRLVLEASARLLDAMAAGERDLRAAQLTLHDALGAVVKAARDETLERRLRFGAEQSHASAVPAAQLGFAVLATALARECDPPVSVPQPGLEELRRRLDELRLRP
jgi:uncharacterized membrane protein YccC